mmetsp:Transcript_36744/g.85828  ORF Transcript_36744/g.85828 Transcript_36744/m.85828 type:complete len:216 (+) Transcript_36744:921-1568(+)
MAKVKSSASETPASILAIASLSRRQGRTLWISSTDRTTAKWFPIDPLPMAKRLAPPTTARTSRGPSSASRPTSTKPAPPRWASRSRRRFRSRTSEAATQDFSTFRTIWRPTSLISTTNRVRGFTPIRGARTSMRTRSTQRRSINFRRRTRTSSFSSPRATRGTRGRRLSARPQPRRIASLLARRRIQAQAMGASTATWLSSHPRVRRVMGASSQK